MKKLLCAFCLLSMCGCVSKRIYNEDMASFFRRGKLSAYEEMKHDDGGTPRSQTWKVTYNELCVVDDAIGEDEQLKEFPDRFEALAFIHAHQDSRRMWGFRLFENLVTEYKP